MTKIRSLISKYEQAKDTKEKLKLLLAINEEIDSLIKQQSKLIR